MNTAIRRAAIVSWFVLGCCFGAETGRRTGASPAAGVAAQSAQTMGVIEGRVQNLVTGRYLTNAQVLVRGTGAIAFTDEFGRYVLSRVPSGTAHLQVVYTGLAPLEVTVEVVAGQTIVQDLRLHLATPEISADAAVTLDPFVVASQKETDGETIALHEQRFAPNIKNVVSTETYGDVVGGNSLADFLKFVPGVQTSGGSFESESVFVRGFPSSMTVLTSDGGAVATSQVTGNTRNITLQSFSINNYSRVEVTKVPTPAMRADTMAGSVNLVSKNAFERGRAEVRYQVNLSGNSHHLTLGRTPTSTEQYTYKINPGFSFDWTLPASNRFGVVVSGAHSNLFVSQNAIDTAYTTSGTGTGASISRPFLSGRTLTDGPQIRDRSSLSVRADWKVQAHSVLSFNVVNSVSRMTWNNAVLTMSTGTNGTPTVAGGSPFSYGDTFTNGAAGRGSVSYRQNFTRRSESNRGGTLRYTFDNGDWRLEALSDRFVGKAWFRNFGAGTFSNVTTETKVPVRVSFLEIDPRYGPRQVRVFNNANQDVDIYDPANFNLATAANGVRDVRDDVVDGNLNLKRRLKVLTFPFSLQVGGSQHRIDRDRQAPTASYTYQGINGDRSSAPFLAQVYANQPMRFNDTDRGLPYVSSHRAYQAWVANPALFSQTAAQLASAEISRITNSERIRETVDAYYAQAEMRLLENRLNLLFGVRRERTTDEGAGALQDSSAVYVRNPDGTFAHNAAGQRIRKPEAGVAGSPEEVALVYRERGYTAKRSYGGYYPSVHLTYNLTPNLLARLAFARTYGRPNFSDIIPQAITSENDLGAGTPSGAELGTINMRNTGLRPWTARNYDFTLDYYTETGGAFGASVFHKDIDDFFGAFQKVATLEEVRQLGLDPRYEGWRITTRTNVGSASVEGLELSASHSLQPLGAWGRYFKLFANATKLKLRGPQEANFTGFLPKSLNWGVSVTTRRASLIAKWNYRGEERRSLIASFGPDANTWLRSQLHLDLNLSYSLRPDFAVFLSARNVFNVPVVEFNRGSQTPYYAQQSQRLDHGVPFSVGVKGSF